MDLKKEICEMVMGIDNEKLLIKIFSFIRGLTGKE